MRLLDYSQGKEDSFFGHSQLSTRSSFVTYCRPGSLDFKMASTGYKRLRGAGVWKAWHPPDPHGPVRGGADGTAHLDALNHPDDWFEFSTLHLDSWHSMMERWDSPGFSILLSTLWFTFLLGCPSLGLHALSSVCQTSCAEPKTLVPWVLRHAPGSRLTPSPKSVHV